MILVERCEDEFIFRPKGLHKLWALKTELRIPVRHVMTAYKAKDKFDWKMAKRRPGTYIPGVIKSGSFIVGSSNVFYHVLNKDRSIVVELENEYYSKLIIEVLDPDESIDLLIEQGYV